MKRLARASTQSAINLIFFAILGTTVLSATYQLTHEQIVQSEEREKMKLIGQLLPTTLYDNEILQDTLPLPAPAELGLEPPATAYRARLGDKPSAVILPAAAPDGYGGKISLILAIRTDGELLGVRVVAHKETPGLGDYIDTRKSDWIKNFTGLRLAGTDDNFWQVKKDGGYFDYRVGATITPRAIIKAVHRALRYFEQHRAALLAVPAERRHK